VTIGLLSATIRQIPGVSSVVRWQKGGLDHLYIQWHDSEPEGKTYIDLKCAVLFGSGTWRYDPQEIGRRGLNTIRELLTVYRRERVQELQRSVTA
jgi:hypothetical protein